jgi:Spy/CpxP family protein refolding chaperone
MKQLADELKLTDAQRSQIHDTLRESFKEGARQHHEARGATPSDWHAGKGHLTAGHGGKKALEAFREDKLDVDKLGSARPAGVKAMPAFGLLQPMVGLAEKVVPILTPEQRKLAADKIRAGDPMLGHGRAE